MTVVPDDNMMTLICDGCGETAASTAVVLPDDEVVWTLVSEHGWSGSPFATGPHRCAGCTPSPPGRATPAQPLGVPDHSEVVEATAATPDPLRTALDEAIEHEGRVVVDLSAVEQIDSVGLGLLVRARQEARQRGAELCLHAPSRFVLTVLHTMRLDAAFPVVTDHPDATNQPKVLV
ncbi:STAS domain-containing protein [Salinispora tropica]|uniref:Sulfate transporter/antisigma-factor antagonist STAS n=1 Tax=Salinispora tropica (strain ATCC BAA-916 / DSM 44818 / JCM 13857 / NBRC 105044 / CNB-440) TaxID=369723 RepID=A4X816_SALTO|nr:STAS domain-containing protein [Salinispora tropica]ABP55016.1 Sulfate transporter/antisigma-factor antagonist STAS [Salinispora tropica CNB-440]